MTDEQIEERLDYLTCLFRLDFRVPNLDQYGNNYKDGKLVKSESKVKAKNIDDEDEVEDYYDEYEKLEIDYYSYADDELMESYRKDFFALGRRGEIRFHQECYDYYKASLVAAKARLNVYAAENIIAEEDKKHMKKKFVKDNEERTVEHIAMNHNEQKIMRRRMKMCREKLIEYGVMQPKPKKKKSHLAIKPQKMDSIDKVLYSYELNETDPTK